MKTYDFKSVAAGILVTVIGGLLLQAAIAYWSKNPKTELVIDYLPLFVPTDLTTIVSRSGSPFLIERKLKDITPTSQTKEDDVAWVIDYLGIKNLDVIAKSGSVYRIAISNQGALSEKDVKIWVKDAVAYYRKSENSVSRISPDKDGYISINQLNPGEGFEYYVYGSYYFLSYSIQESVRAFSSGGTIPIRFVTLKPSLYHQLTDSDFLPFATAAIGGISFFLMFLFSIFVQPSKSTPTPSSNSATDKNHASEITKDSDQASTPPPP